MTTARRSPEPDPAAGTAGDVPDAVPAGIDQRDRIDASELRDVLAAWDVGRLRRASAFERGSRRSPKVRLETDAGVLLLKRRQPMQAGPDRVAFAHAAMAHLHARKLPVAAPIPTRDGVTALRLGEHWYELFPFLAGRRPRPDALAARAAGAMLARLHLAGADFDPPGPSEAGSWHAVSGLRRTMEAVPKRIAAVDPGVDVEDVGRCCRFLRRAYADAAERAAPAMAAPTCLVHGDWHPGNMLAAEEQLTAVLDFDAARLEPRIADLANGCLQFAVDRPSDDPREWPGVLGFDRIRAFMTGYESHAGTLAAVERDALPWLMTEALVIESVAPIVREGRFGRYHAAPFLQMVERKVRWLRERSDRLYEYLDRRHGSA